MISNSALVVFSGGQDSTTCLYWAKKNFKQVHAVFFHYGQRHEIEWESAQKIAQLAEVELTPLDLSAFTQIGGNALIDPNLAIEDGRQGLPNTFVPGRNLIFLSFAAALAWKLGTHDLVTGVCEADFSGYPDCRRHTMDSLENTLKLGMEWDIQIHTPLMHLSKAASVLLAQELEALPALAYSHTCYEGQIPPCGKCPSCVLRANGFAEAGIPDPLVERVQSSPHPL